MHPGDKCLPDAARGQDLHNGTSAGARWVRGHGRSYRDCMAMPSLMRLSVRCIKLAVPFAGAAIGALRADMAASQMARAARNCREPGSRRASIFARAGGIELLRRLTRIGRKRRKRRSAACVGDPIAPPNPHALRQGRHFSGLAAI